MQVPYYTTITHSCKHNNNLLYKQQHIDTQATAIFMQELLSISIKNNNCTSVVIYPYKQGRINNYHSSLLLLLSPVQCVMGSEGKALGVGPHDEVSVISPHVSQHVNVCTSPNTEYLGDNVSLTRGEKIYQSQGEINTQLYSS